MTVIRLIDRQKKWRDADIRRLQSRLRLAADRCDDTYRVAQSIAEDLGLDGHRSEAAAVGLAMFKLKQAEAELVRAIEKIGQ